MIGWAGLAGYVAAFDVWALLADRPTLSGQFGRAAERHPLIVFAATTFVVAHLYGRVPQRFDPLMRVAALLTPRGASR